MTYTIYLSSTDFCFHEQLYYLEQKWVFLALINSGNFEVVVWGSQQFCTPAWQNFIRGLMQLKYFGFKWTRKTHSHWVVKSGRVLYVHLWRVEVCVSVCVGELFCVRLYLSIPCDCSAKFRLSSKESSKICFTVTVIFIEPKQASVQQMTIEIRRSEIIDDTQHIFPGPIMRWIPGANH